MSSQNEWCVLAAESTILIEGRCELCSHLARPGAEIDVQGGNRSPGLWEQFEVRSGLVSVLPFKALFS